MDLLKILLFKYLFGYILQGFAIVLGVYAFNKQKLVLKEYFMASSLVIVISYFVRLLPISYGVHTILNLVFLYLICTFILKMPGYTTVRSSLFVTVLLLISEMLLVAVMISTIGQASFEKLMQNPIDKAIIGAPVSICFAVMVYIIYYTRLVRQKNKGD